MSSHLMELLSNNQFRLAKRRKTLKNLSGFQSFKNCQEYKDHMFPLFQNEQYHSLDLERQQYLNLLKEGKSFPLVFNVTLNEDHDLQQWRSIRLDLLEECDFISNRVKNHKYLWKTQNYTDYLIYQKMKTQIMAVYSPGKNQNEFISELGLFQQSQNEKFIEIPLPNRLINLILENYENNQNGVFQLYFQPMGSTSMYINEEMALLNIQNCPFEFLLLNPSEKNNVIQKTPFSVKIKNQKQKYFKIADFKNKFNQSQLAAITDAVNYEKKMSIIMGPPGTGKTQTTIGIISIMSELLHETQDNNSKGAIMVLAKSNKVVNDLVRKINYNIEKENSIIFCQKSKPDFLKVVRIGRADKCEEDIAGFSLEILSQNQFFSQQFKPETTRLEQKYFTSELRQKLSNLKIRKNIQDLLSFNTYFSLTGLLEYIDIVNQETSDQQILNSLGDYYLELKELLIRNQNAYEEIEQKELKKCNIIVSTLNSCSNRSLEQYFDNVLFRMCIIDEAPTALEPSILIPFVKYKNLQKIVLLGDNEQLEPITVALESKEYKFNRSMFERLSNPLKHNFLRLQYRQMPNLAEITSKIFYEGKIGNGIPDMQLPKYIQGKVMVKRNRLFFNTPQNSEDKVETSQKNNLECQAIISLVAYLLESNPQLNQKITIISAYRAQRDNLFNHLVKQNLVHKVELDTVDSFQGKENDIIILSLVRSNKKLGFLKDKKRINVALSRARYCQYIFGTAQTAVQSRSLKWMKILKLLEQENEIIDYTQQCLSDKLFFKHKLFKTKF